MLEVTQVASCVSVRLFVTALKYTTEPDRDKTSGLIPILELTNIFQMIPQTWNTKRSHVTEAAYFS